jgi:pyruvate/2-oxoglutarate dehydrogenase complex dihydrolipoamide dehydrogenase (E3) component
MTQTHAAAAPRIQPQVEIQPDDAFNRALLANVRPNNWEIPRPPARYNLVVIGAGPAGLISAASAAGLGAKVALVERHLLGGDCLNVGCVPSKALLRSARAWSDVRDAEPFGVHVAPGSRIDFAQVMARMRQLRASLSPVDSAQRYRELGVDVYFGQAAFSGPDSVDVGGRTLRFRRAIIATGARASRPPVPGLDDAEFLTNETVFSLTELPQRLAVIGGGAVGCELAQAFARFGSQVHLIEVAPGVLPSEDRDAADCVARSLTRDGIQVYVGVTNLRATRTGPAKHLSFEASSAAAEIDVDEILICAGRTPNVDGLNLEAARIVYDRAGVTVDDRLRTSNRRVYAAGDICSRYKFTHAADALARIAVQNALFFGRARPSALTIPWCTYTDPEVAHVGLYERDARERGIEAIAFEHHFRDLDRAILDGQTNGFIRVLVKKGTDSILGATIVASHAGELISEISLAMTHRLGLKSVARTIHPYPTQAECIKKVADAYNRTRLTPRIRSWFERWFAWTR